MYLKNIHLYNYCGYRDTTFNFFENNQIKKVLLFHGPNGSGKTSLMHAIKLISTPFQFMGRNNDLFFRKLTYHEDYDPTYASFKLSTHEMKLTAIFSDMVNDYTVSLNSSGIVTNELPKTKYEHALIIDADNPMELMRFQISEDAKRMFLDIAEEVYGYRCLLQNEVEEYDPEKGEYVVFWTDFIITKPSKTGFLINVHYKRMSDGEKKIATMLRMLCNPSNKKNCDIYIIDNIEQHIYWSRHITMMDKLKSIFSDKQIIASTHSGELIQKYDPTSLYDLRSYL